VNPDRYAYARREPDGTIAAIVGASEDVRMTEAGARALVEVLKRVLAGDSVAEERDGALVIFKVETKQDQEPFEKFADWFEERGSVRARNALLEFPGHYRMRRFRSENPSPPHGILLPVTVGNLRGTEGLRVLMGIKNVGRVTGREIDRALQTFCGAGFVDRTEWLSIPSEWERAR
jgi:hypothetical protein